MTEIIPRLAKLENQNCRPRITVVMPTYRRSHQIGESIQSLLEGTWTDFELLVCDDGNGQDGTREAVEAASKGDGRVHYYRNEKSLKMPGNLNSGIVKAQGDFIAVCHDHDIYKPHFLECMLQALDKSPTAYFAHCAIDVITQTGDYVQSHIGDWQELSTGPDWLKFMLGSLNCPVCALTLVRREAHEKYGLYDSAYGFIADVEMWMRLSLHGDVVYIREPLIKVREREIDHEAAKQAIRLLKIADTIHRRYIPQVYSVKDRFLRLALLQWRVSRQILREKVAEIVRGAFSTNKH